MVWDPRTGRESQVATKKPVQWTELLAALPDGRLVLNDGGLAIVLSDPTTGRSEALIDLEREEYGVGCVAPLPGARLAVGMGDGPIGIWRFP